VSLGVCFCAVCAFFFVCVCVCVCVCVFPALFGVSNVVVCCCANVFLVKIVVSLVRDQEKARMGISDLINIIEEQGLQSISCPITDKWIPSSMDMLCELVIQIMGLLRNGRSVIVHWYVVGCVYLCVCVCVCARVCVCVCACVLCVLYISVSLYHSLRSYLFSYKYIYLSLSLFFLSQPPFCSPHTATVEKDEPVWW
jgi:hypothetical protein